jgi:hypothetical protein
MKTTIETVICWLKKNGMLVNQTKTELCFFKNGGHKKETIVLDNIQITTTNTIKILGIIFDSRLDWTAYILHATTKARRTMQAIRILRKFFNIDELLQIAKAKVLCQMYYGSEIWLGPQSKEVSKKQIRTISTTCIRLCVGDFERAFNTDELHNLTNTKTVSQYEELTIAKTLFKIVKNTTPEEIFLDLLQNHANENRSIHNLNFLSRNKRRVGKNCFANRVGEIVRKLMFDWNNMDYAMFNKLARRDLIQ